MRTGAYSKWSADGLDGLARRTVLKPSALNEARGLLGGGISSDLRGWRRSSAVRRRRRAGVDGLWMKKGLQASRLTWKACTSCQGGKGPGSRPTEPRAFSQTWRRWASEGSGGLLDRKLLASASGQFHESCVEFIRTPVGVCKGVEGVRCRSFDRMKKGRLTLFFAALRPSIGAVVSVNSHS